MSYALVFLGGVAVGAAYQKVILSWKNRAQRAARAAQEALREG